MSKVRPDSQFDALQNMPNPISGIAKSSSLNCSPKLSEAPAEGADMHGEAPLIQRVRQPAIVVGLDRTTQYPRGGSARAAKPRRDARPPFRFAEYITQNLRQSRYRRIGFELLHEFRVFAYAVGAGLRAYRVCCTVFAGEMRVAESMRIDRERQIEGILFLSAYVACIPLANWLIQHVGMVCPPGQPCLIPVAPGIMAPSGVLMVGLALVLRDLVQRRLGVAYGLGAIAIGTAISAALAPPSLVLASGAAFFFSETVDFAIYTPLQRKGLVRAVLASSMVGLLADSVLFLWLAFGSLEFLAGQVIGKALMVFATLPAIHYLRRRDARLQIGIETTASAARLRRPGTA